MQVRGNLPRRPDQRPPRHRPERLHDQRADPQDGDGVDGHAAAHAVQQVLRAVDIQAHRRDSGAMAGVQPQRDGADQPDVRADAQERELDLMGVERCREQSADDPTGDESDQPDGDRLVPLPGGRRDPRVDPSALREWRLGGLRRRRGKVRPGRDGLVHAVLRRARPVGAAPGWGQPGGSSRAAAGTGSRRRPAPMPAPRRPAPCR